MATGLSRYLPRSHTRADAEHGGEPRRPVVITGASRRARQCHGPEHPKSAGQAVSSVTDQGKQVRLSDRRRGYASSPELGGAFTPGSTVTFVIALSADGTRRGRQEP